jgi:pimeloyl-ACP methyl ester carboxylesterase
MVTVKGRKMHILELGGTGPTVVMLPGLGTAAPAVDFSSIADLIAAGGVRCVIPEPFGYGWSDDTDEPRTVANIVDELREGLALAGFSGSYYLFVHSISGIYMRFWADRFPDGLLGIIGDDISLPEQFRQPELAFSQPDHGIFRVIYSIRRAANGAGIGRLWGLCSPTLRSAAGGDAYKLRILQALSVRNQNSNAVRDETRRMAENAAKVENLALPRCPLLLFTSGGSRSCASIRCKSGFSWIEAHQALADAVPGSVCSVLPGPHYLHWKFAYVMAEQALIFIEKNTTPVV